MKISVIVPVYNVENYLGKCLNSLVNQTLPEIEILVINDGSTDNSQKIIEFFQNKFPQKIKAFTKKNGGLSDARNFGIERAIGKFIAFVDSDGFRLISTGLIASWASWAPFAVDLKALGLESE